jgi:hypothetical protein
MSTDTDHVIQRYRATQEWLSTPGRKIRLVGSASYTRPCPQCRQRINQGETIIKAGEVRGRWSWICPACAPQDLSQLPHIASLIAQAVRTPNHALLKKAFWQELDGLAKERGVVSGRELLTQTVLERMEQTRTPELAGCRPVGLGERGVGVIAAPGKQEIASEWVRAAEQASLEELGALLNTPLQFTAPVGRPVTMDELVPDSGANAEEGKVD